MGRLRLIRRSRPSLSIPCVLVLIGGHWFPSTIARITAVRLVAAQPCRPTQPQAQCLILRGGDGWGPEGLNYSRFDKLECSETESTSSDASSVRTPAADSPQPLPLQNSSFTLEPKNVIIGQANGTSFPAADRKEAPCEHQSCHSTETAAGESLDQQPILKKRVGTSHNQEEVSTATKRFRLDSGSTDDSPSLVHSTQNRLIGGRADKFVHPEGSCAGSGDRSRSVPNVSSPHIADSHRCHVLVATAATSLSMPRS